MKKIVCIGMIAGLLLAGCASFEEAYYTDREHGKASTDAFDRMIVNKEDQHAGKTPEGLDGIHAEPIMGSYNRTFSQSFTRESIDISAVGPED
jgi:uncharacterized protein YceK